MMITAPALQAADITAAEVGNVMVSEIEYFRYLYAALEKNSLLPEEDFQWRIMLQQSLEYLKINTNYIKRLREETGDGFENVFLVNARKAMLLRGIYTDAHSLILERTSVYFAVLGCVLDYMIDNGSEEQGSRAAEYLNGENCRHYFCDFAGMLSDSVIDELFYEIGKGLKYIAEIDKGKYNRIISMIKKAAESELFVSGEKSGSVSATDKAIVFAMIPLEITAADLPVEREELFFSVGRVMQIIDDLCDVFDDIKRGQANPYAALLNEGQDYKAVISSAADDISKELCVISDCGSEEFYEFIRKEITEWSMGSSYIRERIWKNG